jgi:hypothetical protein
MIPKPKKATRILTPKNEDLEPELEMTNVALVKQSVKDCHRIKTTGRRQKPSI